MDAIKSIYGKYNTEPRWYALKTRSRHEKTVNDKLQLKGIESFLPLCTTYKNWSDRKKKVSSPLFSCYLFVKIALKDRFSVLQTDGAVNLISFNGIPAPIPDHQIDTVRQILEENISIQRADYFTKGQKVEVTHGLFKGIQGIVQETKDKSRLIISIDVIQQAISMDIDASKLKIIE